MGGKYNHQILDNNFAELLLDSMSEGVFTIDLEGRITSWNPAMERISGYGPSEAIGKPCNLMSLKACSGEKCPENISECTVFEKGYMEPKKCQLTHKYGHQVPVIKAVSVIKDRNGRPKGLVETLTDITELIQVKQHAEMVEQKLAERHRFANIVGKSDALHDVFRAIRVAAESDATVLLQGESGTGKELVAGAIHFHSDRAKGPLVTVNCSALPEPLMESELFGHVKGAFTGAHRERKGRFEEADGGTLFLDEIGDITPYIQVKLLRVIQERKVERLGENRLRPVDIRIITATHKDLYAMVREGLFREDLYYRLKVFPINIPPLRARKEDIPLLVDHFIRVFNEKTKKEISGVCPDAMRILMDYPWPGNVRELENAIEHAFVVCQDGIIDGNDLPIEIRESGSRGLTACTAGHRRFSGWQPGRSELLALLKECGWNKAEVARRIGKSRTSVWKYMKKYNIPLRETAAESDRAMN